MVNSILLLHQEMAACILLNLKMNIMKKDNLHIAILEDHPLILSGLIDLFKRNQLIA
jgi:hypothetical protein